MDSVYLTLWQSVWRQRSRTGAALALLLLAKLATVTVPLSLKAIVDRFSASGLDTSTAAAPDMTVVLTLPVFLLLAYALLRFAATLFTELRDRVFARVTLRTVSDFAQHVFAHLMQLSPRFHSQRSTGTLIRDVERGTLGIAFLLGAGLFTVLPTLVEFLAVLVVMIAAGYSGWFDAGAAAAASASPSTASSAPLTGSRRIARTAAAGSSATVSRMDRRCTAAPTVRAAWVFDEAVDNTTRR